MMVMSKGRFAVHFSGLDNIIIRDKKELEHELPRHYHH
jgi:hypothetical protein